MVRGRVSRSLWLAVRKKTRFFSCFFFLFLSRAFRLLDFPIDRIDNTDYLSSPNRQWARTVKKNEPDLRCDCFVVVYPVKVSFRLFIGRKSLSTTGRSFQNGCMMQTASEIVWPFSFVRVLTVQNLEASLASLGNNAVGMMREDAQAPRMRTPNRNGYSVRTSRERWREKDRKYIENEVSAQVRCALGEEKLCGTLQGRLPISHRPGCLFFFHLISTTIKLMRQEYLIIRHWSQIWD